MDYSQITPHLYIGTTPGTEDYDTLRFLGVTLVLNMRIERRPYPDLHRPPMSVIWLPTPDFWLIPIPQWALRRGVQAALQVFAAGGKVYAHCAQGVHRGVVMGAAILIANGCSAEEAMRLIVSRRPTADPYAWYIRPVIENFYRGWMNGSGELRKAR